MYTTREIQWTLSKADTYGTEVFVRFREVSALERFELKSLQMDPLSHGLLLPLYLTMGMCNGKKERRRKRNLNLHMFQLL